MGIARAALAVLEIIFQVAIRFRHFLQIRHRGWGQQRASQVRMHNDPGGAGCLGAYCIASTNKIPTALPYFLAACFLTSGMTYFPNISIDDITLSCGIVSVAIRNCNSSTPTDS